MKHLALSLIIVVALVLTGCQVAASGPTGDESAVTAAVNQIYAEYAASLKAGDPDRWAALWTDDGMQLIPDAPALDGKQELRADTGAFLEAFDVPDMVVNTVEVKVSGDWAYARGLYTATLVPKDGSEQIPIDGKYMSIFQKQPDGSWKLHRDVYNSNVPPPAPEVPDEAAVTAAVEEIYAEYAASLKAGDPDRWAALWTNDGMQLIPDAPALDGKQELQADTGAFLEAFDVPDMVVNTVEVKVSGDWAYAQGLYTATLVPKDGSEPIPIDGKYMSIFQKQPDGSWKLHRDVYNSNVPPPAPEVPDEAAVMVAIEAMYTEYEASLAAGDSSRWLAQWVEDGIQMPHGAPPNIGTEMIGTRNRGMLEKFTVEMDINPDEVQVAGDLAFARGLYTATFTPKSEGNPMVLDGKFLTVFQKQPDGSWKIYRDIFNSNVP